MENNIIIYHGSQQIVEVPRYGVGKAYNDYGQGFYCTQSAELAKEWACSVKKDGYSNKYLLDIYGLNIMKLTDGEFNILNWLAILLNNRKFDINNNVGAAAREYLLEHFLPDTSSSDVIIGYRADDSYFSFAEDFVNNSISLRDLCVAMQLGNLGEQVVLLSPKAFEQIQFLACEVVDYREYYYKRTERDLKARNDYQQRKKTLYLLKEDLFVLDIIREEMKSGDSRLRFHIS